MENVAIPTELLDLDLAISGLILISFCLVAFFLQVEGCTGLAVFYLLKCCCHANMFFLKSCPEIAEA